MGIYEDLRRQDEEENFISNEMMRFILWVGEEKLGLYIFDNWGKYGNGRKSSRIFHEFPSRAEIEELYVEWRLTTEGEE